MGNPIIAIMYDFDKTLSTTDMQSYSFIPNLGLTPEEFWKKTDIFSDKTGVERILSYMYVMIDEANKKGIKITKEYLMECGKNIEFYPGVLDWFTRINKIGKQYGFDVEHYLVSSGTREIVEGCKIYPFFTKAWGCEFLFGEDGTPIWPKRTINYTQKTQFFFRIAKGVDDDNDDNSVNAKSIKLRVPFENIIYCGDGMTDIACMTLVKKNSGTSIAIYDNEKHKEGVEQIYHDKRCNFIAKGDYTEGGDMEQIVTLVMQKISLLNKIKDKEKELAE